MSFLIYPAQKVRRIKPVNLDTSDVYLFKNEFEKKFNNVYPEFYNNVKVTSNGAVLQTLPLLNLYFSRSITFQSVKKIKRTIQYYARTLHNLIKADDILKIDKAVLMTDHFSVMFFHWFGDILQKFEALEQNDKTLSDYTFLFPATCNSEYANFTLKKYGFNVLFINNNQIVKADELIYIPLISPSGNFRPELMKNMRSRFRIENNDYKHLPKRLYITRKNAPSRTVKNEEALMPILNEFGYEIISMEELTFQEQLVYASAAEKLVSLHGAGLTHMIWMQKNSDILEIRLKDDTHNNCYFSLASDLSHNYYYLLADAVNPTESTQATDFLVQPDKLRTLLKQIN